MNVYDFDKTIYHHDSTVDFFFYQLRKNPLLIRYLPKQRLGFLLYFMKIINKTEMKNYFYSYLKGVKNIDKEVEIFWDSHIKGINKWYLKQHRDDDIIISASAFFLVNEACRRINITRVICSEVDQYTGEVTGLNCNGEQKVVRFLEAGYDKDDIEEFYSDSYGDTPMALLAKKSYLVKGQQLLEWEKDR